MSSIVIANPPAYLYDHNRHFIQAGSRWSFSMDAPKGDHKKPHYQPFPFSLAYATAIFQQAGLDVKAFDACAMDMDEREFIEYVKSADPRWLIVEVPTVSFPLVMRMLRELMSEVKCCIGIGGAHIEPRQNAPLLLQQVWQEPLCWKKDRLPLGSLWLGANWIDEARRWFYISDNLNFDNYPFPNRSYFPNELYSNFEFKRPSAQMLTSRGCPHACFFCVERHVVYQKMEFRDPKIVVDEVQTLLNEGVKHIYFDDADITAVPDHIRGICEELHNRCLNVSWTCMGDILANGGTLKTMADAGCVGLAFGVESTNPATLKAVNKQFIDLDRVRDFIKKLRDLGIYSSATYSLGLPEETRESIMRTIEFATSLGTDSCQFSIATPFPGTPFFKLCEKNGWLITKDWTRYDGARWSVIDYPQLKHQEIEDLFRYAMTQRSNMGLGFRK